MLGRARESGPATQPVIGDYLVRIQMKDGSELDARITIISFTQPPYVVIGDHQFRLSGGDIANLESLVAKACSALQ
jgi:hypothetical protein